MKERESNIELLRIIAMLFIVILHCNGSMLNLWGGMDDWHFGGWHTAIPRTFIQSVTLIGVDVFVLISGYFSIRPSFKSLVRLFSVLWFFIIGGYLLNCVLGNEVFSIRHMCKLSFVFSRYDWFVQAYLFLMLLAPVINMFVEHITKKQLQFFILIYLFCALYFGCIWNTTHFYFNEGYSVTTLMLVYVIGRYLALYGVDEIHSVSSWTIMAVFLLCVGCGMTFLLTKGNSLLMAYCSPLIILESVCFFMLFVRRKIKSKVVNWIASSSFAVYVFHTHEPISSMVANYDIQLLQSVPYWLYLVKMLGVVVAIYTLAIVLDKLRILLFCPLINGAEVVDDKIKNFFKS